MKKINRQNSADISLLIFILLLSIFGTIMIFSAGSAYAYARYDDAYYFIKKQIVWLLLGFVTMWLSSKIPIEIYRKATPIFYLITLLLLVLVLVIGFTGNGAKRWISIGPLTIQPSEIAKISIVMMLAYYFSKYEKRALSQKKNSEIFKYGTILPTLIFLIPIILVMLQKHLSCIIILGLIGLCMTVAAGVNLKYISSFCALGVIGISALALFTDYTKERITVWRDPEAYGYRIGRLFRSRAWKQRYEALLRFRACKRHDILDSMRRNGIARRTGNADSIWFISV